MPAEPKDNTRAPPNTRKLNERGCGGFKMTLPVIERLLCDIC